MEQRVVELEIALAHQQDLLSKLNEVLYAQQQTIDLLQDEVRKLRDLVLVQLDPEQPNERPPHY